MKRTGLASGSVRDLGDRSVALQFDVAREVAPHAVGHFSERILLLLPVVTIQPLQCLRNAEQV